MWSWRPGSCGRAIHQPIWSTGSSTRGPARPFAAALLTAKPRLPAPAPPRQWRWRAFSKSTNGKFFLTDTTSKTRVELRGTDLAKYKGPKRSNHRFDHFGSGGGGRTVSGRPGYQDRTAKRHGRG